MNIDSATIINREEFRKGSKSKRTTWRLKVELEQDDHEMLLIPELNDLKLEEKNNIIWAFITMHYSKSGSSQTSEW